MRTGRVRARRFGPKTHRSASGCPDLPLSKGQTLAAIAAELRAEEVEQIKKTRAYVSDRDRACTVCHGVHLECRVFPLEMNEIAPRSATRGLPPQQRFNRHNCHMVGRFCHRMITDNEIDVSGDADVKGGLKVSGR